MSIEVRERSGPIGSESGGADVWRPVHIVAARLSDTPHTVLGTYAHLLPSSDEVAAERIAKALAR